MSLESTLSQHLDAVAIMLQAVDADDEMIQVYLHNVTRSLGTLSFNLEKMDDPVSIIDPERFKQALRNLVSTGEKLAFLVDLEMTSSAKPN